MIAKQLPQTSHRRRKGHHDRGAVAVEMALVSPILVVMIIGIIDFSRIFNAEIQLSQAAREGVRIAALGTRAGFVLGDVDIRTHAALNNPAFQGNASSTTVEVANLAAIQSPPGTGPVATSGVICTDTQNFARVTVSIPYQALMWGPSSLSQKAVMRCGA